MGAKCRLKTDGWPADLRRGIMVMLALLPCTRPAVADGVVFAPPHCPFTLTIPSGMGLDPATADDVDYKDGTRYIFGTWVKGDISLDLFCYSASPYTIPKDFLPAICSRDNPNLVEGSLCGPSPKFDGVEVTWPTAQPDEKAKYYWTYVAHKTNKGRLTVRLVDRSADALSPAARQRLADAMQTLATSVK